MFKKAVLKKCPAIYIVGEEVGTVADRSMVFFFFFVVGN